ncbi:unnamed protein product [Cercospora beticola]|nr:unnamed protein product [Cercospora beticola]
MAVVRRQTSDSYRNPILCFIHPSQYRSGQQQQNHCQVYLEGTTAIWRTLPLVGLASNGGDDSAPEHFAFSALRLPPSSLFCTTAANVQRGLTYTRARDADITISCTP